MANFIVTYDLNGPWPSHAEMDRFIRANFIRRGRLCETVWWVEAFGTSATVRDLFRGFVGDEDLLLVVEAKDAAWTKLLVNDHALVDAWNKARPVGLLA